MNLHQAPVAIAFSAAMCAVAAVLFQEHSVAVTFGCAAAVLIVVGATLRITRFPACDPFPRCAVCRQHITAGEYDGLCSAACAAEYSVALEKQEEEDRWWRAIA